MQVSLWDTSEELQVITPAMARERAGKSRCEIAAESSTYARSDGEARVNGWTESLKTCRSFSRSSTLYVRSEADAGVITCIDQVIFNDVKSVKTSGKLQVITPAMAREHLQWFGNGLDIFDAEEKCQAQKSISAQPSSIREHHPPRFDALPIDDQRIDHRAGSAIAVPVQHLRYARLQIDRQPLDLAAAP